MIIGIDLDNTIINYSKIFERKAKENVNLRSVKNKDDIKKILFQRNDIQTWKKIQSEVYGESLYLAKPYIGFISKLKNILKKNEIKIISHKTKVSYFNNSINLHDVTKVWLEKNIFSKLNQIEKSKIKLFLEITKNNKINKIIDEECDIFIDDLEEILKLLPNKIIKYLFNYNKKNNKSDIFKIINNWKEFKIEN